VSDAALLRRRHLLLHGHAPRRRHARRRLRSAACAARRLRRAACAQRAAPAAPRRLTPRRLSPGSASHRLASPVRPCLRPAPPCEDISKCSPSPLSLCLSLWASLSNPNHPRPNYAAQSINVIDSCTFFNLARVGKPHTPTSVSVFLIHCENMSLLIFNQRTGRTRRRPCIVRGTPHASKELHEGLLELGGASAMRRA
jgi:hypothetical protein